MDRPLILTPHFSWDEVTFSETAARHNIDNTPPESLHENILQQAHLMESVREILGRPILVTSWYRSPEVNQRVGGSLESAHMQGLGTDFVCRTFGPPLGVCQAIYLYMDELGIDQLIHEFGRWTHIGLPLPGKAPRRQALTAKSVNGKTIYVTGIQ